MSSQNPVVHIIAGSNGSGKSTFAERFLPDFVHCEEFVNPDLIARGLSPFAPDLVRVQAGRITLKRIGDLSRLKKSFGFETTLSGVSHVHVIRQLKTRGYRVQIYYLWIRQVSLAIRRIKDRVQGGGHGVPRVDVLRRYRKSLRRFVGLYRELADYSAVFDNSGPTPRLIGTGDAYRWFPKDHLAFNEFLADVKGE
jgi:predicted ABC-type ATPase